MNEIERCEFLVIHPEKGETKSFKKSLVIIFTIFLIPPGKGHGKCLFFQFWPKMEQKCTFRTFFGHPGEKKSIQQPLSIHIKVPGTLFSFNYGPKRPQ